MANARGGAIGSLPLHRDVIQQKTASLHGGLPEPSEVRSAVAGGRVVPIAHASTESAQAQTDDHRWFPSERVGPNGVVEVITPSTMIPWAFFMKWAWITVDENCG